MKKRIVLGVQYDGSSWRGWQTQPDGHTVQDRLEAALKQFLLKDVHTQCAGRTDAGVHALEQVVHFDTDADRDLFSWVRGVNAFLPPSIAVRWAHVLEGDEAFDFPRPLQRDSAHLSLRPIQSPCTIAVVCGEGRMDIPSAFLEPMREAAALLVGTHDFSAFRAAECQAKTPVKTMHEVRMERKGDLIVFTLRANAFLHHMVRNIVGSLILVGNGNQKPEWIGVLLEAKDRSLAAPTFMPDGLYLARVDYDDKWKLPQEAPAVPWL